MDEQSTRLIAVVRKKMVIRIEDPQDRGDDAVRTMLADLCTRPTRPAHLARRRSVVRGVADRRPHDEAPLAARIGEPRGDQPTGRTS